MSAAKIAGVGKYIPEKILTNYDLEKTVDTSDEWITSRTGIKTRHVASEKQATSDLAVHASLDALRTSGIKPRELDLIIVATVTPDTQFPSTACYVQHALGAANAACFDISSACAGFVYALAAAWQMIKGGLYKKVLVIGAEKLSSVTDWKDRSTCVLLGDGSGAAVLVETKKESFLSCFLGSDGSLNDLLVVPAGGSRMPASVATVKSGLHSMKMKGNELFKLAVRIMVNAAEQALKRAQLTIDDIDLFIPHQANIRIINAVAQRLNLPEEKLFVNIEKYGNMSAASTAVALCEAHEQGRLKKGNKVVLDAFGSGLVWGSCVIEWSI